MTRPSASSATTVSTSHGSPPKPPRARGRWSSSGRGKRGARWPASQSCEGLHGGAERRAAGAVVREHVEARARRSEQHRVPGLGDRGGGTHGRREVGGPLDRDPRFGECRRDPLPRLAEDEREPHLLGGGAGERRVVAAL